MIAKKRLDRCLLGMLCAVLISQLAVSPCVHAESGQTQYEECLASCFSAASTMRAMCSKAYNLALIHCIVNFPFTYRHEQAWFNLCLLEAQAMNSACYVTASVTQSLCIASCGEPKLSSFDRVPEQLEIG